MKSRRWLRIAGYVAAGAVVLFALALGLLQTGPGRSLATAAIESAASSGTSTVSIEGLGGFLPSAPSASKITLSDARGPWLVLHDVRADWSPFALLFGEIVADDISVGRAELLRTPQSATNGDADDDSVPAISIGRFAIETVSVSDEVAGGRATFAIAGGINLLDPSRETIAALNMRELGGGGAVLKADLRYALASASLAATLDIQDRAGGALARLAGLPADAPLSVKLVSGGALSDWRATLAAQGGRELNASGTATVRREGDRYRLVAQVDALLGAVGPVAWRTFTTGRTRLTLDASQNLLGAFKVGVLELETPALRLNGSGAFDPAMKLASGRATLNVADGSRLAPILGDAGTWRDLQLSARLDGAWPTPVLDIDAQANDVALDSIKASQILLTARAVPDRQWDTDGLRIALSADARATGLVSSDATLRGLLGPALVLKAQAATEKFERFSNVTVDLRSAGAAVRFLGDVEPQSIKGEVSVDAADLSHIGFPGGGVSLHTHIDANRETAEWQLDGSGSLDAVNTGDTSVDGLLRGKNDLSFALSGTSFDTIRDSKISLTSAHATALVQGGLEDGKLDFTSDVVVPDLSVASAKMSGRAEAHLKAAGPVDAPAFSGTATFTGGTLFGVASKSLALDLSEPNADGLSRLTLKGDLVGKRATANADFTWRDKASVRVDRALVSLGSVTVRGDLAIARSGTARGVLAVDAGALQDIAPLIDLDVGGRANGTITLGGDGARQSLSVALTSPDLRVDTVRLSRATISSKISDAFGAPSLDARAQAASADIDGFVLIGVDVTGRGSLRVLDLTVKGKRAETAMAAQGRLFSDERPTRIALNALSLSRAEKRAHLMAPVELTLADGQVSMRQARIDAGGGRLSVSGSAGRVLALALEADRLPLWVAEFFGAPLPATGLVTGTVQLRGPASERQSQFDLTVRDLAPREVHGVSRNLVLAATGTTDRGGAVFKATLSDPRGTTLRASGRVPFDDRTALSVAAQGEADLALANIYLSATGDRARGRLSVSANVSGTLAAPRVAGSGSIKSGFFRSAQAGLELRDIEGQFEGSERHIKIVSLSATAPNGGTVNGQGDIGLDRAAGFPIDLSVKASNAQLVATDLTTVTAAVDARMSGALMRTPVIRGSADIERWDIRVPERLARPLTPIAVTHRNAPGFADDDFAPTSSDSAFSFKLDLAVRAPRRVFVRGQGIDAEFGGTAKISGTADDPVVMGRFDLRRGSISLLSERVALTKGSVIFSGGIEPVLDISGSVRKSNITATIGAKGRASDPAIVLSSTPTLPQDEILARLLFSKGTQQLSVFEAAQLAQAIGKWSGLSTGPDILDRLRSTLGIDALSAVTDDKGATAVSAGRYVGSGVFVGLTKSASDAGGGATVEFDLSDEIKLRGEVGATNSRVGVAAEWEY